ncbi:Alpha/Beta hydrolase fold [Hyaloscypha variabilis]
MDPEFATALAAATRSHNGTGSIPDIRKMIAVGKMEYLRTVKPWKGTSEDITIPTRDGAKISVRIYRPSNYSEVFKLPLVVWYHGGGFCLGDLDSDDSFCRRVTEELKCIVANVDYRLAPEHPFPTPVNDCWDAFQWVKPPMQIMTHSSSRSHYQIHSNATSLGADPTKGYIIGGGSAGANATSVIAHLALDHQIPITGVHLGVPLLIHPDNVPNQYRAKWRSYEENKDAPMLSRESANILKRRTIQDDGLIFEEILRSECGVKTKLDFYPGVPHAFNAGFPELEISKKFVNDAVAGFGWLLANKQ